MNTANKKNKNSIKKTHTKHHLSKYLRIGRSEGMPYGKCCPWVQWAWSLAYSKYLRSGRSEGMPYGKCCPWVHWAWSLDVLRKLLRHRRHAGTDRWRPTADCSPPTSDRRPATGDRLSVLCLRINVQNTNL